MYIFFSEQVIHSYMSCYAMKILKRNFHNQHTCTIDNLYPLQNQRIKADSFYINIALCEISSPFDRKFSIKKVKISVHLLAKLVVGTFDKFQFIKWNAD